MQKVLVRLPQIGTYRFKHSDIKSQFEKVILTDINELLKDGRLINCIREDYLALELLHDLGVEWLTALNPSDLDFMRLNIEDYPKELYNTVKAQPCSQTVLDTINSKVKLKSIRECRGDIQLYNKYRLEYINKKIKMCSDILESRAKILFKYVTDFDQNAFNCKLGDGRLVVITEIKSGLKFCEYGGCDISEEQASQILEVI